MFKLGKPAAFFLLRGSLASVYFFVKKYKIVNNSTITEAKEKNSYLKSLEFQNIFICKFQ